MPDAPLREDAQCGRENGGVQILATLRSVAINALRLDGIRSISEGIAALVQDIGHPSPLCVSLHGGKGRHDEERLGAVAVMVHLKRRKVLAQLQDGGW